MNTYSIVPLLVEGLMSHTTSILLMLYRLPWHILITGLAMSVLHNHHCHFRKAFCL